ncbi:MAG: S-layer homology domain-containing protein [Clostridia bacterium]|nr:S-layer homology domain-containing protein [Clostridia bacterium]
MKKPIAFILAILMISGIISGIAVCADNITLPKNTFMDVGNGQWYTEGVLYCYKYGYMAGVSDGIFDPSIYLTRAMFVQMLYSVDMADVRYGIPSFSDVKKGDWYYYAVEWACRNKLASGVGGGLFSPNTAVTREQLALFLYKYSQFKGENTGKRADLGGFSDSSQVSSWAYAAVSWAVAEKLISGMDDGRLSPKTGATRAQASVILKAYLSSHGIKWDDGKVVTARTCTVDGVTEFSALNRYNVTKTVTYKAWHDYDGGTVTIKPTCTAAGVTTYKCKVCGFKSMKSNVAALGHTTSNGVCTRCGLDLTRKHLTVCNSDTIAILGDSGTESFFAVKDKAFISKLSQFSDYQFFNYGASGKTLKAGIFRMQNNIKLYDGSFGYQDVHPKYTLLLCYINDIKEMNEDEFGDSLRSAIDSVRMYGSEPIICNEFKMNSPLTENIFYSVAKEKNVLFWDVYKLTSLTQGSLPSSENFYSWYWKDGHPGTRTNNVFSDAIGYYLDKLESPSASLKVYRLRNDFSVGTELDSLLFDSQLERYGLFREISVAQRGILPEDVSSQSIDDLSGVTAESKVIPSEYDILRENNKYINIGTKCALISATLPYTDLTRLKLSFSTGITAGLKVYIRDQNASPKLDGNLYMRFDTENTSGINVGDTFTTVEDGGEVVWKVQYVVTGKCIYCRHETANVKEDDILTGGTVTINGRRIAYSQRLRSYYYYEESRPRIGHYVELKADKDGGGYTVPESMLGSVLNYDRADFLITAVSSFELANIDVEYSGSREKTNLRGNFEFGSPSGANMIANPKFDTLAGWRTTGYVYPEIPADGDLIPGTSRIVGINDKKYISTELDLDGGAMGKKYTVDVYARYYPEKGSVDYDSLDYKRICLRLTSDRGKAEEKNFSQYQILSTSWKICRFEIIAPAGVTPVTISVLGADGSPLQVARVECAASDR